MKHLKTILYLTTLSISMTLFSCGGDDSDTPATEGDGIFTATIAANTITSNPSEARAVLTKGSGGGSLYSLYVQGFDKTSKKMIHFTVRSATEHTPGTFSVKLINSNQAYYFENKDAAGETIWIAPDGTNSDPDVSHGTITYTEITSNRTKGTFSFTGRESGAGNSTRTITNGSFDVPLKRQGF